MRLRTVPVLLAFLCMGFGDAVGPFVSLAKGQFHISMTLASLIPFVGFMMFGLLSVPMGVYQDKRGKKFILLLGLAVGLVGMGAASLGINSFPLFLLTIMMLGAAAAILQVAGNPMMRDVSEEGKYSRNLSLGQFVKAIGSLCGPVVPVIAARWFGVDWRVIFPVFGVAMLITILSVSALRVEEQKHPNSKPATLRSSLALMKDKYVAMMVIGIFVYVGAEVSVSAGVPLLFKARFGVDIERLGLLGTGLFFAALTIGRFSGGVILNWFSPQKTFIYTCILSLVGLLGIFTSNEIVAIIAVLVIGLGFANIFPLIFSILIDKMPEHSNALSGLMVTAIVGGAILPLLMGIVADSLGQSVSFLVPTFALLFITWVAIKNLTPGKSQLEAL